MPPQSSQRWQTPNYMCSAMKILKKMNIETMVFVQYNLTLGPGFISDLAPDALQIIKGVVFMQNIEGGTRFKLLLSD